MVKSDKGRVEIKGTAPELFADTCVLLKGFREQGIFSKSEILDMVVLSCAGSDTLDMINTLVDAINDEDL